MRSNRTYSFLSALIIFVLLLANPLFADKNPQKKSSFSKSSSSKKESSFSRESSFSKDRRFSKDRSFNTSNDQMNPNRLKGIPGPPVDDGDPVPIGNGIWILIVGSLIYFIRQRKKHFRKIV